MEEMINYKVHTFDLVECNCLQKIINQAKSSFTKLVKDDII